MTQKENLIEDFSTRIVNSRRVTRFDLMYKGIEIEGTCIEYLSDFYTDYDIEIVLETEDLTDEDISYIEDYIRDNIHQG